METTTRPSLRRPTPAEMETIVEANKGTTPILVQEAIATPKESISTPIVAEPVASVAPTTPIAPVAAKKSDFPTRASIKEGKAMQSQINELKTNLNKALGVAPEAPKPFKTSGIKVGNRYI